MTPSEHEIGSPGENTGRLRPELVLRSSKETILSDLADVNISNTSSLIKTSKPLSSSESRLPLTAGPLPLSKSRSPSNLRSQSHERSSFSSQGSSPSTSAYESNETHKSIIVRSFAPRVAVFASSDTEDFVRQKGFQDGLYSLLRPYGERSHGKVIIRDSAGVSRGWDDFGIRFMDSQALQKDSVHRTGASIDRILDIYLRTTVAASEGQREDYRNSEGTSDESRSGQSQLYPVYLRKLLSSASIVPYETFSHPVACLIAVSSRHPAPIEALRQLYATTGHEGKRTHSWMGTEYLRYYVLIHDEENDDISKSIALFDLMKRHFGLHCHLLRLRQSQCVPTDDDSTRVPSCEWLSAEEEGEKLCMRGRLDRVFLYCEPSTDV